MRRAWPFLLLVLACVLAALWQGRRRPPPQPLPTGGFGAETEGEGAALPPMPEGRAGRPMPRGPGAVAQPPSAARTGEGAGATREPPEDPTPLGTLSLSDDAAHKRGEFWLEQALVLRPPLARETLADLYLTLDPRTLAGLRLRLTDGELRLERVAADVAQPPPRLEHEGRTGEGAGATHGDATPEVLAKGAVQPVAATWSGAGRAGWLGALWRGGELSAWWNEQLVFTWRGDTDLKGASAARAFTRTARLGARRVTALGEIRFSDSFLRQEGAQAWRPCSGYWELTALAFPERSANPFALRASFDGQAPEQDKLYQDRVKGGQYGLGVVLSAMEGTFHIARITGGSPAARAGLQEDDTIIRVNGYPVEALNPWRAYQLLAGDAGEAVRIEVLRPGEKQLRHFEITKDQFRWGTPLEGRALAPPVGKFGTPDPAFAPSVPEALVVAGEAGWSDYRAEASLKPLGAGGCGLAIAVTSPRDYLLLRWLGPTRRVLVAQTSRSAPPGVQTGTSAPQTAAGAAPEERLQLVRIVAGQETVLAEKPLAYRPYEFYRFALDWRGEDVKASVDGAALFEAKVPGLRRGQVGLYALRGDPVYFDDVEVAVDRASLLSDARPERRINAIFASEQDMEGWANPALEWARNEKSPWAVHTARFPGEQVIVLNKPRFDRLEVCPRLRFHVPTPGGSAVPQASVSLFVQDGKAILSGQGFRSAEANVGPGPFNRIALRAGPKGAVAELDGKRLEAPANDPTGAETSDLAGGDFIGIRGLKNLGDPATVRVTSSGTLEYSFDSAPVDWKVESGRWGLLNKWICDPRWSWFGGRTETAGAIWNKHVFGGNVSFDAHVALMMKKDEPPYDRAGYERPGDYNLVLCGDGTNLDSGYSLICGGGGNYWTRLYRHGKLVAEATAERFRLPGDRIRQPEKPELHQRWFHLRLEKVGRKVAFYRDGEKAFEFDDPEPLAEGRVGFWTCDNGVLLARARIAADRITPGPLETRRAAYFDDGTVVNLFDGEAPTRVEPQAVPRAIAEALAAPPDRFTPAEAAGDAEPDAGNPLARSWRVTNGVGGGPFALQWRNLRLMPASLSVVRFAVRIEPGAAVDFCLKDLQSAQYYRWRMSGPAEPSEDVPLVGQIPGVAADGKWHAVQFDLGPSWRAFWRNRAAGRAWWGEFRPLLACLDHGDYAVAGFHVNHAGASYSVSPITLYRPADVDRSPPRVKKVIWPYDDVAQPPSAVPERRTGEGGGAIQAGGDTGQSLRVVFEDPGGSGVDLASVRLALNGKPVPPELVGTEEKTQSATLDLAFWRGAAGMSEGERLELTLLPFRDWAGNVCTPPAASWTFSQAEAAKKPAAAPDIRPLLGFRNSAAPPPGALRLQDVTPFEPESVRVEGVEDAPPWALVQRSLQVTAARDGTKFGFRLRHAPYSLAQWPYLALEYKIPPEVPVNLHFQTHPGGELVDLDEDPRGQRAVILSDTGDPTDSETERHGAKERRYLPRPPEFRDDGTWRRVEIPLLQLSGAPGATIHQLDLHDNGWRGNRQGMRYAIHACYAIPASRSDSLAFNWSARDLAGLGGYASAVDENPDTVPTGKGVGPSETLEGAARRLRREAGAEGAASGPLVADGWKYFHLRLQNKAGAWSPTVHYKFRVDNTPPAVARTEPADGAAWSSKTVRIHFAEDHAVMPNTIQLLVNGEPFSVDDGALEFDPVAKVLTFDASRLGERFPWPERGTVAVELRDAADSLGNVMRQPYRFSFRVDRSLDTHGPAIAQVRFCAPGGAEEHMPARPLLLELSMQLDFEETLGHVRALQDCRLDWVDDPKTAAFGRRSVRFVALEDDGNPEVMLHKNAWHMDRLPALHFDYKADPGFKADLRVLYLGEWYTVRFLGAGAADEIGRVPGAVADGQWHHAGVSLGGLVAQARAELPARILSQVKLTAHGQPGTKRGAALWLDNLHLAPANGSGGRVEWRAEDDPSGIEGYSFLMDHSPATEAPLTVTDVSPTRAVGWRQGEGTWWLHLRALDQAGRWGPTRHYRLDF